MYQSKGGSLRLCASSTVCNYTFIYTTETLTESKRESDLFLSLIWVRLAYSKFCYDEHEALKSKFCQKRRLIIDMNVLKVRLQRVPLIRCTGLRIPNNGRYSAVHTSKRQLSSRMRTIHSSKVGGSLSGGVSLQRSPLDKDPARPRFPGGRPPRRNMGPKSVIVLRHSDGTRHRNPLLP